MRFWFCNTFPEDGSYRGLFWLPQMQWHRKEAFE
jgi:hypothetical protein